MELISLGSNQHDFITSPPLGRSQKEEETVHSWRLLGDVGHGNDKAKTGKFVKEVLMDSEELAFS